MSRENVIRQIVERDLQDRELSERGVRRDAQDLYTAACECFGTWDTALHYAGISQRRVLTSKVRRTKAKGRHSPIESDSESRAVLRKIRELCLTGYDLSANHNARRDRPLYDAAQRHFGSWEKALAAVGINLENAFPRGAGRYDRDELLGYIRDRHESGKPLVWHLACFDNVALARAIKHIFGSWGKALAAASLASEQVPHSESRKWDRQRVLDAINCRHREGKSLQCSCVRKEQSGLVSAARRFFPTWGEAVSASRLTDS